MNVVVSEVIANASNIRTGDNPPYLLTDFYANYPAYAPRGVDPDITYLVDPVIIQMYLDLANACIKEVRWRSSWKIAMGWFIAHFLTLYLQSMADANSSAAQVITKGQTKGLMSSKSVGDVSVSYDYNTIAGDLDGWASWKLTSYGTQLATMGRLVGKGGSYVW